MAIIRTLHDKENPYVIINKKSLWDDRLSIEAVGILARLLSRPNNWKVSATELAKSCKCGIKKIYNILNELIEFGYCFTHQEAKKGQKGFGKYEYYILEESKTIHEIEEIKKSLMLSHFMHSIPMLSTGEHATNTDINKERYNLLQEEEDLSIPRSKAFNKVIEKWKAAGRSQVVIEKVIQAYKDKPPGSVMSIPKWMESVYAQKLESLEVDEIAEVRRRLALSRPSNYHIKDDVVTYISGACEQKYSLRGDHVFWSSVMSK